MYICNDEIHTSNFFFLLFDWFHLPETVIEIVVIFHADTFVDFRAVKMKLSLNELVECSVQDLMAYEPLEIKKKM